MLLIVCTMKRRSQMEKIKYSSIFYTLLLTFLLQGCATSENKLVTAKVAAMPNVADAKEAQQDQDRLLDTAPGLTDKQRTEISELRKSSRERMGKIKEDSLKLHQILINDLVAQDFDYQKAKEVEAVKAKIYKLDKSRTRLRFVTIEKMQKILGRDIKDQQAILSHVMDKDLDERGQF